MKTFNRILKAIWMTIKSILEFFSLMIIVILLGFIMGYFIDIYPITVITIFLLLSFLFIIIINYRGTESSK
jgi:uncharacterized membrane protein